MAGLGKGLAVFFATRILAIRRGQYIQVVQSLGAVKQTVLRWLAMSGFMVSSWRSLWGRHLAALNASHRSRINCTARRTVTSSPACTSSRCMSAKFPLPLVRSSLRRLPQRQVSVDLSVSWSSASSALFSRMKPALAQPRLLTLQRG